MLSPDRPHHATTNGKLSRVSRQREVPVVTVSLIYFARMTLGVFGSACFMAYLWATYIVPETANVSLEMIDEVFRSPASQEDMVVKRQVRKPF
jgi:hypothetical protein